MGEIWGGGGVEEDLLYISYENKETENKDPRGCISRFFTLPPFCTRPIYYLSEGFKAHLVLLERNWRRPLFRQLKTC